MVRTSRWSHKAGICDHINIQKKHREFKIHKENKQHKKRCVQVIINPQNKFSHVGCLMIAVCFAELKDFLPYIYFEHECVNNQPQTVKMCRYYKNEESK